MSDERAVISAELEGANAVVSGAKKISSALKGAEKDARPRPRRPTRPGTRPGGSGGSARRWTGSAGS